MINPQFVIYIYINIFMLEKTLMIVWICNQKNTTVIRGLYMCMCWLLIWVWLFVAPWTISHQAHLCMEFSRQEYWSGLPFPFLGDLTDPGIEPGSPALQEDSLPSEPPERVTFVIFNSLLNTSDGLQNRHFWSGGWGGGAYFWVKWLKT